MEAIAISPETIPLICERIRAMLTGRAYQTVDKRGRVERGLYLDKVHDRSGSFIISDSYGVHSINPGYGPASVTFTESGFTIRHGSASGEEQEYTYTVEALP